jgi:2-polyprenyl-3-methyl-5-hydroxy-6-metoxy-1,4-benzoquinol methylase
MPHSTHIGKEFIRSYLTKEYSPGASVLDIGAGAGTYANLLRGHFTVMDAVEIYAPYIRAYGLASKYRKVYNANAIDFVPEQHYSIVILGDVLEHLTVSDAQALLQRLYPACFEVIVSVPYLYVQPAFGGNASEHHEQDDLTHELMLARYPGLRLLADFSKQVPPIGIYHHR